MNSGGEPERDDTGLPPVDIEIPDDARELDRDVQAYYREQRAERRRLRHHRLHRRITRDGIVLPLLACCLILALITGTLLTVFTATSDQNQGPLLRHHTGTSQPPAGSSATSGAGATRPAAHGTAPSKAASSGAPSGGPSTSPASSPGSRAGSPGSASALNPDVAQTRAPLPAGTLRLAGRPVPLRSLGKSILVLVPPACGCSAAVSWLARVGASHAASTYLVGTRQTISEANYLNSRLSPSLRTKVPVAFDSQGVLAHEYPIKGLTAVMVASHSTAGQTASYAQNLSAADTSAPIVRALTG